MGVDSLFNDRATIEVSERSFYAATEAAEPSLFFRAFRVRPRAAGARPGA